MTTGKLPANPGMSFLASEMWEAPQDRITQDVPAFSTTSNAVVV